MDQGFQHQNVAEATSYKTDQMQKILTQLEYLHREIREGNIDGVKFNIDILLNLILADKNILTELSKDNKYLGYELIICACEHEKPDILYHLLRETDILEYLQPTKDNLTNEEEDKLRSNAFKYAILADNMYMVKILYDYWRGDIHWSESDYEEKTKLLSRLETILNKVKAEEVCEDHLCYEQSMKRDIRCLIKFNQFLQAVYTRLHANINYATEAIRAKEVVTQVLNVYNEYFEMESVRTPKETTPEDEDHNKQELTAKKSYFYQWLVYLQNKEYYTQLHFYVSLFVLDNLNFLKERSNKDEQRTQILNNICSEVEDVIYHFIYREAEDWRLYLPKDRKKEQLKVLGLHKGEERPVKVEYDEDELDNSPVIFLEMLKFKKCLQSFITKLETLQKSCPAPLSYMKDYYSLKKMVYYMKAVSDKQIDVLAIDRVLLVIGEIINSENPDHLSVTTIALLQTMMSVDSVKLLHWIRNNYLGRANFGELTNRIAIANAHEQTYRKIQTDIETIMTSVESVLQIYKPILDKSLLQNGLNLIETRIKEWPSEARQHMHNIYENFQKRESKCFNKLKGNHPQIKLTVDFFKEIVYTQRNKDSISTKIEQVEANNESHNQLLVYFSNIRSTLDIIDEYNEKWDSIKEKIKYTNYPTDSYIQCKINNLAKSNKTELKVELEQIKDYSGYWQSVKNALKFFHEEMCIFNQITVKVGLLDGIKYEGISKEAINEIRSLLTSMETAVISHLPSSTSSSTPLPNNNILPGIEELKKLISPSSKTDTFQVKRDKLISALIIRLRTLKDNLKTPQKPLTLLSKYRNDINFRIVVEILFIDITNIFVACGMRSLMNKSTKLLASVDLRNVLVHGNHILEVIGDVLDPYDFPSELLSKAKMVVEDTESIEALYKLFVGKLTPESIEADDKSTMNEDQKNALELFKKCERWEMYLRLVQQNKKENIGKTKKNEEEKKKRRRKTKITFNDT